MIEKTKGMIKKTNSIKNFTLTAAIAMLVATIASPVVTFAAPATTTPATTTTGASGTSFTLLPPWYKGLDGGTNGGLKSPNDVGGLQKWLTILALNLVTDMLYVTGYVSLGFIIWGGFKFMLNGDNSSGVASARKTIQNAVIGLVISIFAVAIVNAISGAFGA